MKGDHFVCENNSCTNQIKIGNDLCYALDGHLVGK